MFALLAKCRKCDLQLFDSLVTPVMLYACEVWGFEKTANDMLEKLHLKFLKYILHVKTSTCNNMVYGELGRYPLHIDIKKRMIGYWGSLLNGKESKTSRVMYDCLLNLHTTGTYSAPWIIAVQQILDDCGLSYIWLEQKCDNVIWLKMAVEQRLKDQFLQTWHYELQNMTSCDLYCEFKKDFKLETYLLLENRKHRQAICNFRLLNNRIPKIIGRYKGLDRNKRFCDLCDGSYIGDEFHVLFECKHSAITEWRKKYLPTYFVKHPSMFKCILFLQMNNIQTLCKLGGFLSRVLPLFK